MRKIIFFIIVLCCWTTIKAQTYNVDNAVKYAHDWCDKRNFDYYYYGERGGDCANFVSQCLKAGGLDLSVGIDPNEQPPNNGVDGKGCIIRARNLVKHLKQYQNTTSAEASNINPPSEHDVGDPMFLLYPDGIAYHSYFCSSLDANASRLYCAHTGFACDVNTVNIDNGNTRLYFHIKNSIPAHCENCKKDGDETGIDCGGSCPPCQHAPENKIYNYNTDRNYLPAETYAINNITAGGANVIVYSGQNVSFFTAGSIDLTPGFEAKQGSDFTAQVKKKRLEATADCNAYCDPIAYNYCTPCLQDNYNDQLVWTFSNARQITVKIYQWKNRHGADMNLLVHSATIYPQQEGDVVLWDLFSGNYNSTFLHPVYTDDLGRYYFDAYVNVIACQGQSFEHLQSFIVNWDGCHRRSAQQNTDNQDAKAYSKDHHMAQNIDYDDLFSLYPNPTSGALTISSSEPLQAFSDLTLTNGSGQTVYGQKYLDNFTLSLPALPNGEYILSVQINRQLVSRKVIIQR
jgi:hypothetical protein